MGSIAGGQPGQPRTIEPNPPQVQVIRVLPRHDATGPEPHLPGLRVDPLHPADHPFPPGHPLLDLTTSRVAEIQVVPPIPLRHPQRLALVGEAGEVVLARVVDEGLRSLVDGRPGLPRQGVERDQPQHLVAALVVHKADLAAVGAPLELIDLPGLLEQFVRHGNGGGLRQIEQPHLPEGNGIARLDVRIGVNLGLQLIAGGRFHERDLGLGHRAGANGEGEATVGRPVDFGQGRRPVGSVVIHLDRPGPNGVAGIRFGRRAIGGHQPF